MSYQRGHHSNLINSISLYDFRPTPGSTWEYIVDVLLVSAEDTEPLLSHQFSDTLRVLKRCEKGELTSVRF